MLWKPLRSCGFLSAEFIGSGIQCYISAYRGLNTPSRRAMPDPSRNFLRDCSTVLSPVTSSRARVASITFCFLNRYTPYSTANGRILRNLLLQFENAFYQGHFSPGFASGDGFPSWAANTPFEIDLERFRNWFY